jgi:nucleotide-binding universal stress UspA family protein
MVESLSEKPRRHKVLSYVNSLKNPKADFFVVGFSGSKGMKADHGIMGLTTDYSLRGALMSTVVVKGAKVPKRGETHKFVLGVDGSERSKLAADRICSLAASGDVVVFLHVFSSSSEGDIGDRFREPAVRAFFKEYASTDERCQYVGLDCSGDGKNTLADSLVSWAEDNEASFVAVGADGVGSYSAGKKETALGSFSDRVVKCAQVSVVVVQNRDAVYGESASEETSAGRAAHK